MSTRFDGIFIGYLNMQYSLNKISFIDVPDLLFIYEYSYDIKNNMQNGMTLHKQIRLSFKVSIGVAKHRIWIYFDGLM